MKDFIVRDRSHDVTGKIIYSARLVRNRKCVYSRVFSSVAEQIRWATNLHCLTGLHIFSVVTPSIVYPDYPVFDQAHIVD